MNDTARNELTLESLELKVSPTGMNSDKTDTGRTGTKSAALVYVVDDEPMVGDVVLAILKMGGFQPVFFEDPHTALKAFSEANPKPDLLLTDFQMPQMTGRELIQKCKQVAPGLKTILYSGNVQEDTVAFYPARPDSFLRKPFTPKTLIDLVKSVLGD